MNNQIIDELTDFCAIQYYDFNADEWLRRIDQYSGAPVVLARYLSETSWYGHSVELERIADTAETSRTGKPSGTTSVDIARFSGVIRFRIALMQAQGIRGNGVLRRHGSH
jgi:hypothetical protein